MGAKSVLLRMLPLLLLLGSAPIPAVAAESAVLTWTAVTTRINGVPVVISKYKVLWGAKPGVYTGNATTAKLTYTWSGIPLADTMYFTVIAVDSANVDSAPSAEKSKTWVSAPAAPGNLEVK